MTHIPYKGSGQAFTDMMGGRINAMFLPVGVAINMSRDGKVRVLGVSTRERSKLAPEIPSLQEMGIPGFHADIWLFASGPAGLSADIVKKYNAAFRAVMDEPEVRAALVKQGVSVGVSSPEDLAREAKAEYESLARLVKAANIKGD
jgi:tripartite-type tricarboxylate transporter receptor subunit TctC